MRLARRGLFVVICVIIISVSMVIYQCLTSPSSTESKYQLLKEPAKDRLNIRYKLAPSFIPLKLDLFREQHQQINTKHTDNLPTFRVPIKAEQRDNAALSDIKQSDSSIQAPQAGHVTQKAAVVAQNGSNSGMLTSQIKPELLTMIEEIIQRATSLGQKVQLQWTGNWSCPDMFRVVNGVEDLLCMPPPKFLQQYKNPCWISNAGEFQCLPYFQVIGMDKCGSTDLFDRIAQHPQVLKNRGTLEKETMWWSWKRYGHWLTHQIKIEPFSTYLRYFSRAASKIQHNSRPDLITGDGTPMDMWDMSGWISIPQNEGLKEPRVITPHLIRHVNPAVKLIVILRDPVQRVFSDYFFLKIGKQTAEDFHKEIVKAIKILHTCTRTCSLRKCLYNRKVHVQTRARLHLGFYSIFLRDWLSVFPRDQILILKTEDYAEDMASHLQQIHHFLSLDELPHDLMQNITRAARRYVTKKKTRAMLDKTKAVVTKLYEPFNADLADILQDSRFLWQATR